MLVLIAGCDQVYGLSGRIDDARPDAISDAANADATCSGPFVLDTDNVVLIPEFAGANTQPCLSNSGREMFFTALNVPNRLDLFRATRTSLTEPWSVGVPLAVNSELDEGDASITADGLRLFFTSNRAMGVGRMAYEARRSTVTDEWAGVDKIDISFSIQSLDVSPDGKTLYVVDGDNVNGLYRLTRSDLDAAWTAPMMVGLGTDSPSVDAADQVMYWSRDNSIKRAVRSAGTFLGADLIVGNASDPDLSHDGTTLTFSTASGLAYAGVVCSD